MATTEELAIKLTDINGICKSHEQRIDKVESRQDNLEELVTSVTTLANEQKYIKKDVSEIKTNVKALTDKPAKRWDGLVDKIIAVLVAGFIGFLMAQIGLGG